MVFKTSSSARYSTSESRRSRGCSWSPHHVCQCKRLHLIRPNTRSSIRHTILCILVCRCGSAMSSHKGVSFRFHAAVLWARSDHILRRLPYQHQYASFLDALRKAPQDESDPLEPFPGARAFLDELQEDSVPSAEEALDYLLEAAIDRFGYSARDVFSAVFDFQSTTEHHQQAFNVKFAQLKAAVSDLAVGRPTNQLSYRILVLPGLFSPLCEC